MDLLERMARTEFLGREFLTWLWFKSEEQGGRFAVDSPGEVEIRMDDRVTLKSDAEESPETVACSGENSDLREARFAMAENKKVTQARFRMVVGEEEWSFSIESGSLNVKSMRPPRVSWDAREDPEGLFFERIKLLELALSVLDAVFLDFMQLRLSEAWEHREVPAMTRWIRDGLKSRQKTH